MWREGQRASVPLQGERSWWGCSTWTSQPCGAGEGAEDVSVTCAGLEQGEWSSWSCGVIAEPSAANIPPESLFGQSFQCKVAQIVY